MDFMTVKEASEKWNIGNSRIVTLCSEGRIEGTVKFGSLGRYPRMQKSLLIIG